MTLEEIGGPTADKVVAWSGDGNNVANSWIHAAGRFGFTLRLACPKGLGPEDAVINWAKGESADVTITDSAEKAIAGADLVIADTWVSMGVSMGDEDADARRKLLQPFRVDGDLMAKAKPDALFMHCLPAHRGEEVTDEVMDGPHSVIWDEAENRLHAQKGILAWCLG